MEKRLLIYTQDVGGTRYLMPVLEAIHKSSLNIETLFLTHPLSEAIFRSRQFKPLNCRSVTPPLSEEQWLHIFQIENITHVLCTLSSPYFDPTNGYLIQAARRAKIRTLGFMDHWKGYDRFYNKQGEPCFFTEWIGCPDTFTLEEFRKRGVSADRLYVVGHPGLEFLLKKSIKKSRSNGPGKILIVSQPVTRDRSFMGIFFRQNGSGRILDILIKNLSLQNNQLFYRSHPKERCQELPKNISKDLTASTEEALEQYDLFIGLNSMMLFEASLIGLPCLLLELPEFSDLKDVSIPYRYGKIVKSLADLSWACSDLDKTGLHKFDIAEFRQQLGGSYDRSFQLLGKFIDQTIETQH